MSNKSNRPGLKKLSLNKESLRRLVDDELHKVGGAAGCWTRYVSGCSTNTKAKCDNLTDACSAVG